MEIYDKQGNLLTEYDLNLGRLESSTRIVHHPAVEGTEEQWHWEVIAEYPNGGKDIEKVIDVPGVMTQDAWDEEIPINIFVPYTEEEKQLMEEEANKPTDEERLEALEMALLELIGVSL